MGQAVLIDSSAILALLDKNDTDHEPARRILQDIAGQRKSVFMTNFIRSEAYTLIGVRLA